MELYKAVCGAYTWTYESMNTVATSEDSVLDFIYGRIDSTSDDEVIEYKILSAGKKSTVTGNVLLKCLPRELGKNLEN